MAKTIENFDEEYSFLSNFYSSPVRQDGVTYPTVEHAFQACKTTDFAEREPIRQASTPGQAKRLGRRVTLRPDWEQIKVSVMRELLLQKFKDDLLKAQLLATGEAVLIEGNTWHDCYWGFCRCERCGKGSNMLGILLMEVRDKLRESTEA